MLMIYESIKSKLKTLYPEHQHKVLDLFNKLDNKRFLADLTGDYFDPFVYVFEFYKLVLTEGISIPINPNNKFQMISVPTFGQTETYTKKHNLRTYQRMALFSSQEIWVHAGDNWTRIMIHGKDKSLISNSVHAVLATQDKIYIKAKFDRKVDKYPDVYASFKEELYTFKDRKHFYLFLFKDSLIKVIKNSGLREKLIKDQDLGLYEKFLVSLGFNASNISDEYVDQWTRQVSFNYFPKIYECYKLFFEIAQNLEGPTYGNVGSQEVLIGRLSAINQDQYPNLDLENEDILKALDSPLITIS